jgi:N-methylhydantoinase B/oxoprolinase/acetone carboxylase alpha subunit
MKNNFNAPEPVARAAVLYAFRVMVEDNIPMNAGCLRPIDIVIPEGCMLRPPIRRPSSPAMSRPRSTSPTRCSAPWARWPTRRAR